MIQAVERAAFTIVEAGPAWEYYTNFRQHLRGDQVGELVSTRGNKPLSLEELQFLVGYDLGSDSKPAREICTCCGQEFSPISWVNIADPKFLDCIYNGASIENAFDDVRPLVFGSYYLNPDAPNGYGAFCGKPYAFVANIRKYVVRNNSCIAIAKTSDPDKHWGIGKAELDYRLNEIARQVQQLHDELKKREEQEERRQKFEQEMAAKQLAAAHFFRGKPSRGCKHNGK